VGPQGRSGRAENLVPTGIRSRTIQPVAQSLYRLSYPVSFLYNRSLIPGNKNLFNPLKPNDPYRCRTAPLTSNCLILYIYSRNIGIEYFKRGIYSPFFSLQNAVSFIILTYLVPVLFTFYIQGVLKLKKIIIPAPNDQD
jgi:hypothetical protein